MEGASAPRNPGVGNPASSGDMVGSNVFGLVNGILALIRSSHGPN